MKAFKAFFFLSGIGTLRTKVRDCITRLFFEKPNCPLQNGDGNIQNYHELPQVLVKDYLKIVLISLILMNP